MGMNCLLMDRLDSGFGGQNKRLWLVYPEEL